jgi:hypothetical protein
MNPVEPVDQEAARRRRRLDREVRASLRDVSVQLSLLNHQVRGAGSRAPTEVPLT